MNTMLFWNPKDGQVLRVKITQSKQAMWRNSSAHTRRSAFGLAARQGWEHITTRTRLNRLRYGVSE